MSNHDGTTLTWTEADDRNEKLWKRIDALEAQVAKMRAALELVAEQRSDLPFIQQARECLREIDGA